MSHIIEEFLDQLSNYLIILSRKVIHREAVTKLHLSFLMLDTRIFLHNVFNCEVTWRLIEAAECYILHVCGLWASDKWYVLSNRGEPMSTRGYVISSDKCSREARPAGKHRKNKIQRVRVTW
jgi:hypothetical protein